MKKNLPTIRQSTEVALSRANTLMDVADKILAKQSTDLVDESWMERLWQWADDNHIDDEILPRNKERLVNLTKLELAGAQLTELPKEIGNLVNLTSFLDLTCNQLTNLPKEIGNLVNLVNLSLWDNQLTELPKEIGNLVNLGYLSVGANPLSELPKEIGNLVNLNILEVSRDPHNLVSNNKLGYNQCTKLTKQVGSLVNLTHLILENNQLTELPKEIGNLVKLTALNIRGSQITNNLPEEIINLVNIKSLVIGDINVAVSKEQLNWIQNIENVDYTNVDWENYVDPIFRK